MGDNQGRLLQLLDDIGHGEGFPRTGYPQENLILFAFNNSLGQFIDGLNLVSDRLEGGLKLKFHNLNILP